MRQFKQHSEVYMEESCALFLASIHGLRLRMSPADSLENAQQCSQ